MKAEDRAYYSNCAAAEPNLAAAATDEQVAKIHREIAERYETLIAEGVDQVALLVAEDTRILPYQADRSVITDDL